MMALDGDRIACFETAGFAGLLSMTNVSAAHRPRHPEEHRAAMRLEGRRPRLPD
jgi:hypothetical protein